MCEYKIKSLLQTSVSTLWSGDIGQLWHQDDIHRPVRRSSMLLFSITRPIWAGKKE